MVAHWPQDEEQRERTCVRMSSKYLQIEIISAGLALTHCEFLDRDGLRESDVSPEIFYMTRDEHRLRLSLHVGDMSYASDTMGIIQKF